MSVTNRVIKTSHADIALSETSGGGLPVLLIHGNSSCKEVFAKLLGGPIGDTYRVIAIDLPGHGASSNAVNPEKSYSMPGYADAAVETLGALGVTHAAVFGWSLGGHIALEMVPCFDGIVGLMISGAPPVGQGAEKVMAGFKPSPNAGLVGKPDLTAEETEIFLYATYGGSVDPVFRKALARADGRARALMFQTLLTGQISDQKAIAENCPVPIAIVNGADDLLVNSDYVGSLAYKNLWDEHCYVLRGAAHVPFLQAPDAFEPLFGRFMSDMQKRAAKPRVKKSKVAAA